MDGEGLLAEHVLPRVRGPHRPLAVCGVVGRHVDEVDLAVLDQAGVVRVRPDDIELRGERLRSLQAPARDGGERPALRPGHGAGEDARDLPCPEDPPPDRPAHRSPISLVQYRRISSSIARSRRYPSTSSYFTSVRSLSSGPYAPRMFHRHQPHPASPNSRKKSSIHARVTSWG